MEQNTKFKINSNTFQHKEKRIKLANEDGVDEEIFSQSLETRKLVDKGRYVKFFEELPYLILKHDISSTALKMLYYIPCVMPYEGDMIEITLRAYNNIIDKPISERSWLNALKELEELEIITLKDKWIEKRTYYINPNLIFKGNRIKYYKKQQNG